MQINPMVGNNHQPHIFVGASRRLSLTPFGLFVLEGHGDQPLWSSAWSRITAITCRGTVLALEAGNDRHEVADIDRFDVAPDRILAELNAWRRAHAHPVEPVSHPERAPFASHPAASATDDWAAESARVALPASLNVAFLLFFLFYIRDEQLNFTPDPARAAVIFHDVLLVSSFAVIAELCLLLFLARKGLPALGIRPGRLSGRGWILAGGTLSLAIFCAANEIPKVVLQQQNEQVGLAFEADVRVDGRHHISGRGGDYYELTVIAADGTRFGFFVGAAEYKAYSTGALLHVSGTRSGYGIHVQKWTAGGLPHGAQAGG